MEGPTPVSALIHAATMVTAGVFLIIRSAPLLEFAPVAKSAIVIIGAMTALFAASVGLVQSDIKKVIAYSTCSQLGYMVLACGLSNYSASLFHLMNHAFFKALLFLSAGSVIHTMMDEQDLRVMGGLVRKIPLTYTMILIGSMSLMGFPFLSGFYSKDTILELAAGSYSFDGQYAYILGTISALFTAAYSGRLLYHAFIGKPKSSIRKIEMAEESP
jgi:NADH-ubiquinone oxidoreductase chain 5